MKMNRIEMSLEKSTTAEAAEPLRNKAKADGQGVGLARWARRNNS